MRYNDINTPMTNFAKKVKIHDLSQKNGRITFEAHVRQLNKELKTA